MNTRSTIICTVVILVMLVTALKRRAAGFGIDFDSLISQAEQLDKTPQGRKYNDALVQSVLGRAILDAVNSCVSSTTNELGFDAVFALEGDGSVSTIYNNNNGDLEQCITQKVMKQHLHVPPPPNNEWFWHVGIKLTNPHQIIVPHATPAN